MELEKKQFQDQSGMLINGVEISNYKTFDKVYYGPIEDVRVLNGGSNFDVINAPEITVSSGVGTTSLVLPVISGTVTDIITDKQDFDIEEVLSINVTGGNFIGGFFEPVLTKRRREVLFDARETTQGGGISTTTNQLTFSSNHNFSNGQKITYRNNGYDSVSIGIGVSRLSNNASYFAKIDNNTTIKLFNTYDDYVSESNQISFASTSISGSGTHKFLTESLNNTISEIKVIEGGSFTNRKLLVKPTGISTVQNSIYFKNHGFNSGEIVEYSYETSEISGITTSNQYYILKFDENSFRLCDAGIGGTNTTNYERGNYKKLNTTGNGFQEFKYPDIKVNINFTTVGIGTSTQIQSIEATPVVKGSIEQIYVYEPGTGYGSNILNLEKKPSLTVKTGRDAQITPIILNGSIIETNIEFGGIEYFSTPDLVVLDPTNAGSGAKLRAVVTDNKITSVSIINGGIGYATSTTVDVLSSGSGEILEASIRELSINQVEKFPTKQTEILKDVNNELSYSVTGYFQNLKSSFNDTNTTLSNIIGWAYDGNPIYGPYSIVDPENISSGIKTMTSSYTQSITNVYDRPSESDFPLGFFVEDYVYDSQNGDLDKNNGRFTKTKDFPNGVYAYHATIDKITGEPQFPYFIGNSFRSNTIDENKSLNQKFDFNNSSLSRNTLGYKILEKNAGNDFIIENEDIKSQKILVESVSKGSVSDISIINSGDNYKVEDLLNFNNTNTNGGGIYSKVSSLKGRNINAIETSYEVYDDALFTWRADDKVTVTISPFHTLSNNDNVVISGFGTSNLSILNNSFKISVPFIPNVGLTTEIASSGAATTEIYVTQIPTGVSVGSSVGIGTEILEILNVYPDKNIFRVSRGLPGIAHTIGVAVSFKPKTLTINKNVDYFDSKVNNRIYFNPQESVGFGTTAGLGYEVSYSFGQEVITKSIPTQSISIENHSLQTNQRLTFSQNGNGTISISTSPTGISFTLPTTESVYAVNKSANTIGIKTEITSDEVFFISGGDNVDDYYFDTNNEQKLGKIQKIVSTVSISTSHSHGLVKGDSITMNVRPNLSVGIGNSTAVRVIYNSDIDNILINPIGFNSIGVNTTSNEITITNHQLKTGDKVLYEDDNFEYLIDANDQFDTTAQDGAPESIFFKPDGTKMYVVGKTADEVNEYELSTPWSPSTATFANLIDITTEDSNPTGIYIRDDGLKFWICGYTNDRIYQYSMSTAWDISTASYDNINLFVGSGNSLGFVQNSPDGIYFKYDGTVLYIIGRSGDFIHQVDLSTPWDVSTASYSGNSTGRLDINPPEANPRDIGINSSGTLLYWVGINTDQLFIYRLSTPWDITSGVEIDRFAYNNPTGLYVSPDEDNFYLVNISDDIVSRFVRPSPLTGNEYYIHKIDDDNINLCDTFKNSTTKLPVVVSFASTGSSSQNISPINPRIKSVKNNNLVFDLSDSSLSGYEFKLYYDQDFKNEFVSTGSTETFSTISVGTIGISTDASFTIKYGSELPERLYYSLENSGYISSSDKNVNNFSEILFIDSVYNQTYSVFGIGTTTFQISLRESPEKLNYIPSECDNLEYTTTSTSSSGPVNNVRIISGGSEYKKLPTLSNVSTINGENLSVSLNSNTIGKIEKLEIINENFEHSSDITLRPHSFISPKIKLKDSNTVGIVTIISGGSGYISPPEIIVVNNNTRTILNSGLIRPEITGNSITNLIIEVPPKGISDQSAEFFAINNTNGVSIKKVESSNSGIFTCSITTPLSGFSTDLFSSGEKVFIEGIQKFSVDGDGFNSSDYKYEFFEVIQYNNARITPGIIDDEVTVSIGGLGTNTGIAKTIQDSVGSIVSKANYPSFSISVTPSEFEVGEKLLSNGIERDLEIISYDNSGILKVIGTYNLSTNEIITGKSTGNIATIESLTNYNGIFDIKFSNRVSEGWENETGKLSEDFQVLQDNDYYQNLSYSIKSRQKWNDIKTPVNSLVHSIGTKNFSDTEIISDSDERVGITSISDSTTIVKDYISEKRVDTINIFDFAKDVDLVQNQSKFLKLKNKKLVNYQESISNIVLRIDNISDKFSNSEDEPFPYKDILKIDDGNSYSNYLFKVADVSGKSEVQLTNLLFLNDNNNKNIVMLQKQSLVNVGTGFTTLNDEQYGDFSIEIDKFDDKYLRFTPKDPFNTEYDIKYIEKKFDNQIIGAGTTSIGFIDVTSRSQINFPGITTNIIGVSTDNFTSFHVNAQIYKEVTNEMNFVELYVTHDGTNTNISEFYFDTKDISYSDDLIGLFEANIDSGSFNLNYTNNSDEDVVIKTRIVGFGTTSVGVGTFRYNLPGQPEGNERSAIYKSDFSATTSGVSTSFLSLDKNAFDSARSLVEVSIGSTIKSIHQIMMISDRTDVYIQQSLSLSASNFADENSFDDASGIGTFGGEISGDNVLVKFYPDSNFDGDIKINSFSECLYTQVDFINEAPDLSYGNSIETVGTSLYLAINGERIDKDNFVLRSNTIPIFAKSINPSDSNITNLSTGNFLVNNHFFSNNEELIYTPKSTFVGVGSTAMMYKNGSINEELPSQVFAIVHDDNNFSISTTKAGSAVTFTSVGEGNAHTFTMAKRNEKTIITVDNIAQYPLTFTKISQSLSGNGGGISTETTTFTLSGITTISPLDVLRIDDEYMNIVNVGFGTTNVGPITNIGTELLVTVERGFVGSSATSHTDGTQSRIYKGSYTIIDESIFFTKSPRGNPNIVRTDGNLAYETSKFTGRVFLRQDYTTNEIYDNFSEEFNGIGRTFTLTINGANSIGAGTSGGNGLVFINGIFQTPTTLNNPNNNFSIIEQETPIGISSIEFSGIRADPADPNSILISESDINQNQIPRGGLIVSLGSTGGLGYAPLVGVSATAVVDASDGSIVSVGLGSTDINGSGYNGIVSIGISVYEDNHNGDVADITANIGAGGTLTFIVGSGGTGYNNPEIFVSEPVYENLEVVGVSRIGIGTTTDTGIGLLLNVDVGASSVAGIGSTYFEVKSFSISRSGYSFRAGDVFKPVGLVTDKNLVSPISEYEFTVLDVFSDNFGSWQFGELDYIDSIKNFQDGTRIRFPLEYNGTTLSFEKNENSTLDLQNVLIVICNGILQDPGVSYLFDGGTSFAFVIPPKPEDKIDIFFYRGTRGLDDLQVNNVIPTLERGDDIVVFKNDTISETITQDQRVVFDISTSDKFETNLYKDQGIDENNYKPMSWTKQKTDRIINGQFVYKTRESTISQIYPTAKIIKDITTSDSRVFVDSVSNFTYDLTIPGPFGNMAGLIVDGEVDPSPANITASIGVGGMVSNLTILNGGSGYVGSTVDIKFQSPIEIGVGIGTTAQATGTITNGVITDTTITNPGFGYTADPKTIIPFSDKNIENLEKIEFIKGFSGIITGIGTTSGSGGHPLALKFFLDRGETLFGNDLEIGYPIFIKDTIVGSGVTSVDSSDADVVGIGTTFLDNIYYVGEISVEGFVGIVTCNIDSGTDIISLSTSGDYVGEFSWGLFTTITRSSTPISIGVSGKTVDVGLSTFPSIQRRGNGIRLSGALPEETS